MEDTFAIQARCGSVIGSVSVKCRPHDTIDELIERLVRSQGASTSAPDVVSLTAHSSKRSLFLQRA